ncbi:MAG: hypothetical protein HY814_04545 [Candidatus Riflebacteria bacterium]|nr:hypothetical protein [Candidatus Riflebacteria bacterium]
MGLGCGQALTDELFERLRAPRLELGGFAQGSRRQLRRFHPGIWDLDADPRSRGVMLLVATQVLDDCGCATSLAVAMGPTAPARAFADWFEERTIRSGLPRFEHSWEDTIQ